jgi:NADP-dependent alcohol dehydrogenase
VESAELAITRTEEFLKSVGMPVRLGDHGIDAKEAAAQIRGRLAVRGTRLGEHGDITPDEVAEIILSRA